MAGLLQQNRDAMQGAVRDFEGALQSCESHRGRVNGMSASLAGVWQGDASVTYQQFMVQVDEKFKTISNSLDQLTNVLNSNLGQFRVTEDDHVQLATPLANVLGGIGSGR